MMKVVGSWEKFLGTGGLMPNPKVGTVTMDISKAIKEMKREKVEFRVDKAGILHARLASFLSNLKRFWKMKAFMEAVLKAKPATAKGQYIKKVSLTSTMGQGIKINQNDLK